MLLVNKPMKFVNEVTKCMFDSGLSFFCGLYIGFAAHYGNPRFAARQHIMAAPGPSKQSQRHVLCLPAHCVRECL